MNKLLYLVVGSIMSLIMMGMVNAGYAAANPFDAIVSDKKVSEVSLSCVIYPKAQAEERFILSISKEGIWFNKKLLKFGKHVYGKEVIKVSYNKVEYIVDLAKRNLAEGDYDKVYIVLNRFDGSISMKASYKYGSSKAHNEKAKGSCKIASKLF